MTSIRLGHSRAMYTVKFVGLKLNGSNFWKHSWRTKPGGRDGHSWVRHPSSCWVPPQHPPDCPSLIRYPASGPGRGLNAIRSETARVHHAALVADDVAPTSAWAQQDHVVTAQTSSSSRADACSSSTGKAFNLCIIQGWFNVVRVNCECTQSEAPRSPMWECIATATCK